MHITYQMVQMLFQLNGEFPCKYMSTWKDTIICTHDPNNLVVCEQLGKELPNE